MAKLISPTKSKEYEKSNLKTKTVYFFKDPEFKVDQLSKEIFKNEDREIYYPLPKKGQAIYIHIQKFTLLGFAGKPPVGMNKVPSKGYGFTSILWPIIEFLNGYRQITEVVVQKGGAASLDLKKGILHLSEVPLRTWSTAFTSLRHKHKAEKERAARHYLHASFPIEIKPPEKKYTPGSLASSLIEWGNALGEFNDSDKQAIRDLFDKLTLIPQFFADSHLVRTKEIIDNKFIQQALIEFDALLGNKIDSRGLEKKWQRFLKKHSWIFSTLFSQPVILHQEEAYVGGKTLDNANGKYNDFLVKNGLGNNVSFVEIKTHLTDIMDSKPYRGKDVFSTTRELSGCINQVLNQRDNFQKEYYNITKKRTDVQTFNSKALVIIGTYAQLSGEQKVAFELVRSNNKDVEVITFDELRLKIESLLKIMTGGV